MSKVPNIVIGESPGRALLEEARAFRRCMTREESLLWEQLRGNRLDGLHFRRQQVIGRFIVDFYCHAGGVVVEIDGPVHRSRRLFDRERDDFLTGLGLVVLRFRNREIADGMDSVLAAIRSAATGRTT